MNKYGYNHKGIGPEEMINQGEMDMGGKHISTETYSNHALNKPGEMLLLLHIGYPDKRNADVRRNERFNARKILGDMDKNVRAKENKYK